MARNKVEEPEMTRYEMWGPWSGDPKDWHPPGPASELSHGARWIILCAAITGACIGLAIGWLAGTL
jgi:hypothetical protein